VSSGGSGGFELSSLWDAFSVSKKAKRLDPDVEEELQKNGKVKIRRSITGRPRLQSRSSPGMDDEQF
jgi:hypothetical protein